MQLTTRFVLIMALALGACGDDDDVVTPDAEPIIPELDAARTPDAAVPDAAVPAIGPVTNLQAVPDADTGIDVSWTNPTDASLDGVLIVRGDGADVTFDPVDGTAYAVDTTVGAGETVVFAGAGTSFNYPDPVPGLSYTFRAWAYDTNLEYSNSVAALGVNNQLPTQMATIEVAVATPGVTVITQPPHFALSGTATYDGGTQTLTVSLGVENQTGRVVFNPKTVIDSVEEGAVGGPTLGGLPYVYYGPEALAIGGPVSRDLVITGVTGGTDPVTVNLHIVDAPMLFSGAHWSVTDSSADLIDLGANISVGTAACDGNVYTLESANANNHCSWRPGVLSPDARSIYVGHRSLPIIRRIDTTTMGTAAMTDLEPTATVAQLDNVAWGPNGQKLYAVLNVGSHSARTDKTGATDSYLLRIDPGTLAEEMRVQLHTSTTDGVIRARFVAFSPDGATAAVPLMGLGQVQLIDVATMTVIDTDAVTAGDQPLDVSASGMAPKQAIFSPAGDVLYVGHREGSAIDHINVIDLTTYVSTPLVFATDTVDVGSMAFDPTGQLWVSRMTTTGTALSVFDLSGTPAVETEVALTTLGSDEEGHGMGMSPDGTTAYVSNENDTELAVVDVATMTRLDTDGDGTNGVTNIDLGFGPGQHRLLVTPF